MKQPLLKRATEALDSKASSGELSAIQSEILARLTEVERDLNVARSQVDAAGGSGDLEVLRDARQALQDLNDEELLLRRKSTEIHEARKAALGQEAVASQDQLEITLAQALETASKAQAMLEECRAKAKQVIAARRAAAEIGADLRFDREVIKALSALLYTGNESKQAMIDLGALRLREARYV